MIKINNELRPADLRKKVERLWEVSGPKILAVDLADKAGAAPVFTVQGHYATRGWTDWTLGFAYGSALLQFDAFWDETFLKLARERIVQRMAQYVTHFGTHDHGFNIVSTYGNLWRLMKENRLKSDVAESNYFELALKSSGAVQAQRWTHTANGEGFIHSFNGPHSLFADSIRSLRSLALAHRLGHVLVGERDEKTSLLRRLIEHARTTAKWSVYYGTGRDSYDVRGRVAHESIFNVNDGNYRCPSSQQGYSPFSTWTRGLAWAMLGFAEELEFLETVGDAELDALGGRVAIVQSFTKAAQATCDFYIGCATARDGICYWDTGAPGLASFLEWRDRDAEPQNRFEPVDASASAIAAQGLLRLGHLLGDAGIHYTSAGLTVAQTLFEPRYLSNSAEHEGLLLHTIYHRPNGWDHVPVPGLAPHGESSMWGDYHLLELALLITRIADGSYYTFFE